MNLPWQLIASIQVRQSERMSWDYLVALLVASAGIAGNMFFQFCFWLGFLVCCVGSGLLGFSVVHNTLKYLAAKDKE